MVRVALGQVGTGQVKRHKETSTKRNVKTFGGVLAQIP